MSMASSASKTTFIDTVGVLMRRKWIVIIVAISGSVGVFLFSLISILLPAEKSFLPNYYVPTANVIITDGASGGLNDMVKASGISGLAGLAGINAAGPTASGMAIKIASTDMFVDRIAEEFDFYKRSGLTNSQFPKTGARRIIRKYLQFTTDPASGMMTVGYESIDRELATDIVNRVVEMLEEEFASISLDKNRTQLTLISNKLSDVEAEMLRLQGEINTLQGTYNTLDINALAKEQAAKLASLRAELVQKSLEYESYTRMTEIEDPAVHRLRAERDTLKTNIQKLEKGYRENGVIIPAEAELPQIITRFTRLKGDFEIQRKIYETLIQQQELVKLQVESVPPTFQIYEKASIPERKAGPSRPKICLVVAFASLFFGIVLAFFVDYLSRIMKVPGNVNRLRGKLEEI